MTKPPFKLDDQLFEGADLEAAPFLFRDKPELDDYLREQRRGKKIDNDKKSGKDAMLIFKRSLFWFAMGVVVGGSIAASFFWDTRQPYIIGFIFGAGFPAVLIIFLWCIPRTKPFIRHCWNVLRGVASEE